MSIGGPHEVLPPHGYKRWGQVIPAEAGTQ